MNKFRALYIIAPLCVSACMINADTPKADFSKSVIRSIESSADVAKPIASRTTDIKPEKIVARSVDSTIPRPAGITPEIDTYIQKVVAEQVKIQVAEQLKVEVPKAIAQHVAYIDVNKLFEAQEMKDGMVALEHNFSTKRREVEDLGKKIMEKNDALNKMAQGLGENAREERIQEIAMLKAKYDTMRQGLEQNGQMSLEQLRMKGLKSMQDAVEKVASSEQRGYVFGGGLVRGMKEGDITDKVLSEMNTIYVAQKDGGAKKSTVVASGKDVAKTGTKA